MCLFAVNKGDFAVMTDGVNIYFIKFWIIRLCSGIVYTNRFDEAPIFFCKFSRFNKRLIINNYLFGPWNKFNRRIIIGDGAYGISSSKVDGRILPQTFADGSIMNNVVDVSVGKRSICATVQKVSENDTEDTSTNELYCWGSSTFGQ